MIRDGKFSDIPDMIKLIRRQHRLSKYADRAELHDKSMEQLLMGAVAGQNQHGPDGSYLSVVEHGGKITGFMVGTLGRIYNIYDKLVASDIFLFSEGKSITDLNRLIDGYLLWASRNPKVLEISLSWTDTIIGGEQLAKLYKRKGFRLNGEQYIYCTDEVKEQAA